MKIINYNIDYIPQQDGIEGIYKQIELARVCYKSEDKATTNSAKMFVNKLTSSGHFAPLELGSIYLYVKSNDTIIEKYRLNPYSKVSVLRTNNGIFAWISTNYRVLYENGWLDDLQYFCEPTSHHEHRLTFKFTTQIAISREINRYRKNSMDESSTRFCNYSKDKFGNEIAISCPTWIDKDNLDIKDIRDYCDTISHNLDERYFKDVDFWLFANVACEFSYMNLIRLGWKAEQARTILPLDTQTELYHTAYISDWQHFIEERTAQSAHPDIRPLAEYIKHTIEEYEGIF